VAEVESGKWNVGDVMVKITAYDNNDVIVVSGEIRLWVTEKPMR